jgi:hypothetical protein
MIQASKMELDFMRYELRDCEWSAIRPLLPNKPRGVPRVDDRRVLNGIFWVFVITRVVGYRAAGGTSAFRGDFLIARSNLEQGLKLYDSSRKMLMCASVGA